MIIENANCLNSLVKSNRDFFPVFAVDSSVQIKTLKNVDGDYGILAPIFCYKKLLNDIRETGKIFFIDSGVFNHQGQPWYHQVHCEFRNDYWVREYRLADELQLREKVRNYFKQCDKFSPDFVFAPDIFGEPLLSLYLARIAWEEYWLRQRTYILIGVVQVGYELYNWEQKPVPQSDSFLPHYESPKSFLASLISAYRDIGYQYIALGGLLKADKTMPTGLKFGLSAQELDELLRWSRPEFVLGGLALSRLEVLKKHNVWADSSNWLWWNERYDEKRFANRNAFQEVLGS